MALPIYVLDTLFYSSLLFLIIAGLNLIYGILRVVNLAHASLFTLGAYATAWITTSLIVPRLGESLLALMVLPLVLGVILVILVSLALVTPLLRYSQGRGDAFQLIVTFGLLIIFEDLFKLAWGPYPVSAYNLFFQTGFVDIAGLRYPVYKLYVILFTAILALALWYVTYRSAFGIVLRASSMDPHMATALGLNTSRFLIIVIVLASALAGLGGSLYIPVASVQLGLSTEFLVIAFVGMVIGGLGSFVGAVVGSLIVSSLRTLTLIVFPELELVVLYLVAVIVLLWKPEGIGGGRGW
ncbi:MAG: branched-chain amino acid ABC transporter permease [Acidilobaceae archaeon]|jgi:branched-chain amino acid transport system permease protein